MLHAEITKGRLSSPFNSFRFFLFSVSLPFFPWFYGLTRFRDQLAAELFIFFLCATSFPEISKKICQIPLRLNRMNGWAQSSAGLTLAYVFLSVLPYRSLVFFLNFLSAVTFYFMARCYLNSFSRLRQFLGVLTACGIFYAITGLLQYYGFLNKDFWYVPQSLASRYVNGSHFAAFLFFPLYSALALLLSSRRGWLRGGLCAGLLIMLWAFLLARSRAAWLAFIPAAGIFFGFAGLKSSLKFKKLEWGGSVFLLLGGALIFLKKGVPFVMLRFHEIWGEKSAPFQSLIFRLDTAWDSLHAIGARPWGWGLGTFVEVLPRYRRVMDRFLIDYAHNEFLQMGVDLGIAGMLFLGAFVFFYFRSALLFLKRADLDASARITGAAFLAIATGLFLTSQVDFPLRIYANGLFFAAFLAASAWLFEPVDTPEAPGLKPPPFGMRLALGGIVAAAIIFSSVQLYAQIHFEQGLKLEKNFEWDQAEKEYRRALRAIPVQAQYAGTFAGLLEKRMALSADRQKRGQYHAGAIHFYEQAARHAPLTGGYPYLLARLYERDGRIQDAAAKFRKALELEPGNAFFVSEFGYFALKYLEVQEAVAAFEKFQSLPFKEGSRGRPCDILEAADQKVTNYEDLKRMVSTGRQDHLCLGMALGRQGQWDFARVEFNLALEMARQEKIYEAYAAYFREPIADFYAAHGRPAEALEVFRKSLAFHPGDSYVESKIRALEGAASGQRQGET